MKIVVTGVNGQLGYDVVRELNKRNYIDVLGIDIKDLDITSEKAVKRFLSHNKPDVIIHCAAYTAVDNAEDNEKICYDVNVNGTKYLVESAKMYNAKFLYISTDYVFDGLKQGVYNISDVVNPLSIYGESKLRGELKTLEHRMHFIVRISWAFGYNGNNFVKTMLKLGREKDSIDVVNDQYGSPTYTRDLSKFLIDLIETDKYGTYHATNEGFCTWYDYAKEIFAQAKMKINVNPVTSGQYITKAIRPMNSKMDKSSLVENGFEKLPPWQDALKRYLKEIEVYR